MTFEEELAAARERDRLAREANAEKLELARLRDKSVMEHGIGPAARERLIKPVLEKRDRWQTRLAEGKGPFEQTIAEGAEPGMFE